MGGMTNYDETRAIAWVGMLALSVAIVWAVISKIVLPLANWFLGLF